MKAVQIQGVPPEAAVYITTRDSALESHVFASEPVHNPGQAPIFFAPIGDGFLGYIGDVNAETASTAVILAMCNLTSDELICKVCGKVARQKCGRCVSVRYCSRECQVQDWKTHKPVCGGSSSAAGA